MGSLLRPWLVVLACRGGAPEPVLEVTAAVEDNPHGAGMTAVLQVEASEPVTLAIEVVDPDGARSWTVDAAAATHEHLLLGLRPGVDSEVRVTASGASGTVAAPSLWWAAEPLPDDAPLFEVSGVQGEPGVTLLHVGGDRAWMVDGTGTPVWTLPLHPFTHQIAVTERGTLLCQLERSHVVEVALSGEVLRAWTTDETQEDVVLVDLPYLHHDVVELPGGHLLALSVEERVLPTYPSSDREPGPDEADVPVAGDLVVELDEAGAVVRSWALLDLLDPTRIGYGSVGNEYWHGYLPAGDTRDWSHGNAVWWDAEQDRFLVSLRHQDAVVAVDADTSTIDWIFAPDANWSEPWASLVLRPEGPDDLPAYHQHAARLTPEGTLLLFDNGNARASPFEERVLPEDNHSRCLEVAIDAQAGTWSTVWTFGRVLGPELFSLSHGDCDRLPETGNTLVTFTRVLGDPEGEGTTVFEVDPSGEVVWTLVATSTSEDSHGETFRSERVAGLIPGR